MSIPSFDFDGNLPPGIHLCTWEEAKEKLAFNSRRQELLAFEELPEALIKARIIRGLTQAQLAKILQVKQQQVQRDETNKYASASFTKILGIQKALNLQVKEELIFQDSKSKEFSLEELRGRWGTDVKETSEQSSDGLQF